METKTALPSLLRAVESARSAFVEVAERLGIEGSTKKLAEDRWTAGQYLEHLVRAEEVTIWRMWTELEAAKSGRPGVVSSTPELTIEEVVDRTWEPREQAPPLAVPSLGGSPRYWLEKLEQNRSLLSAFAAQVREQDLDRVAYAHPISGPFTLRQALGFLRLHLDRHRQHLLEIEQRARNAADAPGTEPVRRSRKPTDRAALE